MSPTTHPIPPLPECPPGADDGDHIYENGRYCHCQSCGETGLRLTYWGYCAECVVLETFRDMEDERDHLDR